ncbi:MAG: exodeoxyribonuclease V subunit gamma, partial [Leptospiraceae bacterium]|nr:exodeoxyribonuclease V subunit gamma [Leptospiraceae bacterium]
MEDLIEALVRVTADPPSAGNAATNSVLIPEYIVVQSPGMERYLSLQLAARHGICANTRFFFPQNFMRELLAVRRGRPFPFDRDRLAWLVYALLPELVVDDRFVILRRYIRQQQTDKTTKTHRNDPENPASALRHMRLSRRIADLYDHYLIHRPEWLLAWQKGEPANIPLADDLFHQDVGQHVQWQSHLWKRIVQADSSFNFQHLLDDFKSHLSGAEGLAPGFPHRLIFLGVSALPELYRQLLSLLGRQVDIHMFNLIPTERITRNIRSGKAANDLLPFTERQSRTLLEFLGTIVASEKPQWNVSKSKTGRSGKSATDGGPADSGPGVAQESPGTHRTRLNSIQNAIIQNDLSASEREQTDRFAEDTSLVIQSCHSPLRELEVLHDWLLEQFRVRPDLHPDEIIVLTPDMETYAPLIEAVFRNPESDAHRITYTIADTAGSPEELEYRDTFFKMLELCSSRFPAGAVLQFCESAPVQRRFGFTQTELDALRLWIQRLNIRWGYNAATKSELGLPAEEANTWERGLHRLLLGYFIPNDRMDSDAAPPLFADLEPAPYMRGDNVALLERFAICLQTLENLSRNLRYVHRLGDWSTILHDAITGLLDDPDGRL